MNYETGKLLIDHKKFKKAYYVFSKLLIQKPNDFRVNFQMGKIYYELNDLNKSIFYFNKSNLYKILCVYINYVWLFPSNCKNNK